jgi:hypothetical protein
MMRSEWIRGVGGYQDRGWPEDYDLWLRLHAAGGRFAKVPRMLFAWREHAGRLTHGDPRYAIDRFLSAKVFYLSQGPLHGRQSVIVWGAGIVGKRLSRLMLAEGLPLVAFVDIDPAKIGRMRRGLPILGPAEFPVWWKRSPQPVLLAAVGARGARSLVREQINDRLVEGMVGGRSPSGLTGASGVGQPESQAGAGLVSAAPPRLRAFVDPGRGSSGAPG